MHLIWSQVVLAKRGVVLRTCGSMSCRIPLPDRSGRHADRLFGFAHEDDGWCRRATDCDKLRGHHHGRRDVRVVEGARLESVCTGNRTKGSNPFLSESLRLRLRSRRERLQWRNDGLRPSLAASNPFPSGDSRVNRKSTRSASTHPSPAAVVRTRRAEPRSRCRQLHTS
jgi:hypothetical protein